MEKVTKSPRFNLNWTEFHKGSKNGIISIVGGTIGWFVFTKLGLEVSPENLAGIEWVSTLVGGILLNFLAYFFNIWRV